MPMPERIAIAHHLGMCYVAPEDVNERIAQIRARFGDNYEVLVGAPEDFAKKEFAYHSLDAALDIWFPERVERREKQERREATAKLQRQLDADAKRAVRTDTPLTLRYYINLAKPEVI